MLQGGKTTMARVTIALVLMAVLCLGAAGPVLAQESEFELNPSYGIREILSANVGKRVAIRTGTGEPLEGTVTKVGTHLVHISRLSGKDFYDAVVVIDRIDAVIIRARTR
jgi:hypothetical protein